MTRTRSFVGAVKHTSKSLFRDEWPTIISRSSSVEWLSSAKIRASGSLKTEVPSTKSTPCFFKFVRALLSFHSDSNDIASSSDLKSRDPTGRAYCNADKGHAPSPHPSPPSRRQSTSIPVECLQPWRTAHELSSTPP